MFKIKVGSQLKTAFGGFETGLKSIKFGVCNPMFLMMFKMQILQNINLLSESKKQCIIAVYHVNCTL